MQYRVYCNDSKGSCRAGAKLAIEWRSPCTAAHLCLSQSSILEEYLLNLGLFMRYPEQRVRLENIPQFKVITFYARYLKLIYVGNLGTIIVSRSHAFAAEY